MRRPGFQCVLPLQRDLPLLFRCGEVPDLSTLRGLHALRAADTIFYDRLADTALLAFARPGATCVSVGKCPCHHRVPQEMINQRLVAAARQGVRVVRLKCGDTGIFSRGMKEAEALTAAGVSWSIFPGVTADCDAAAAADSFLTERGQTERVVFATGHRRNRDTTDLAACAAPVTTLACHMGVSTVYDLQAGQLTAGWPKNCTVDVVSKAQTPEQRILRGVLYGLSGLYQGLENFNPATHLIRWPANLRPGTAISEQLCDANAAATPHC